jgi:predicted nucleotidyltransferase
VGKEAPDLSLESRLRQAVASLPVVQLLVLFGSAARGKDTARSDVDIAVLLDDDSLASRRAVENALGRVVARPVDIVHLSSAPPQLRFEIAREGRMLLEHRLHAWADFRARAMIDWWDWSPTARLIHSAAARRLHQQVKHGPS